MRPLAGLEHDRVDRIWWPPCLESARRSRSLCIAALIAAAAVVSAQTPTFKTDVTLVGVDVSVVDARGRAVSGLRKEDFEVLDEGEPQAIQSFSDAAAPYHVLLLFDRSGSTRLEWVRLEDALRRLYGKLRPQDRVAVAEFFSNVKLIANWHPPTFGPPVAAFETRGSGALSRLSMFITGGGTDVYGALEWAVRKSREIEERVCVILMTDGVDDRSIDWVREDGRRIARFKDVGRDRPYKAALRAVSRRRIPFYFVGVNTDLNPANASVTGWPAGARQRMEQIADASGGRLVLPKTVDEAVTLYDAMATDIATTYSLGFYASPDAEPGVARRVHVQMRDSTLRVRQSRDTYRAP